MHPAERNLLAPATMIALILLIALSLAASAQMTEPTPPVHLNNDAQTDWGDDRDIAMATDRAGNWVVVWSSTEPADHPDGRDFDIFTARSLDNGGTWSDPALLNSTGTQDAPINPASGYDGRAHIATDGQGTWLAVWESIHDLHGIAGADSDIFFARSTDDGATWTEPSLLNSSATFDTGGDGHPQIVTDGLGNWTAVWQGENAPLSVSRSTDNGATWSPQADVNIMDQQNQIDSVRLVADDLGNLVIVWRGRIGFNDYEIFASRSTDHGVTWSEPVLVNAFGIVDDSWDLRPHLATNGIGTWIAVWMSEWDIDCGCDGNTTNILMSRSTDYGASWSEANRVNIVGAGAHPDLISAVGADNPRIAADDTGRWTIVWESMNSIGGGYKEIAVTHSIDDGLTWSEASLLSDNVSGENERSDHEDPVIFTDNRGIWLSLWEYTKDYADRSGDDEDILITRWFTEDRVTDSDGDGLTDWDEINVYHSDPNSIDTDGDGLNDWDEVFVHETSPINTDTDGDGFSDSNEINKRGTDPLNPDTDGDGLTDWDEIFIYHTNAVSNDTDGDGLADNDEIFTHETDPLVTDTDGDQLTDYDEVHLYWTDPLDEDTDGDGLTDWDEIFIHGTDPRVNETTGLPLPQFFSPTPPALLNSNGIFDLRVHSPYRIGEDANPSIATDGQGTWLAVWVSKDDLDQTIGEDWDVLFTRSTDNGATWTNAQPLNNDAFADNLNDGRPDLATDGDGGWVVTWGRTHGLLLSAYSVDNGETWSDPHSITRDGTPFSTKPITTDKKGNWVTVWAHPTVNAHGLYDVHIMVSRSSDLGAHWTAPQILNNNWDDHRYHWHPDIATDSHGNWIAVWETSHSLIGLNGVLVARSTDNGETWTNSKPLAIDGDVWRNHDTPSIMTDSEGTWIAMWQATFYVVTNGVYDARFKAILVSRSTDNGATWTEPTNINTAPEPGTHMAPRLETDGHGTWIAVWTSGENVQTAPLGDQEIIAARSSDGGVTWTKPVTLNTNASSDSGHDYFPVVATDKRGHWVTIWESNDSLRGRIGTDWDILFTRWDQNDIFVDLNAEENGIWTEFSPVNTLEEAMRLANPGATIHVKSGDTSTTFTGANALGMGNKPITLKKHGAGAPVRIGAP